jgi:D-glycero-D-manno-heptose 1,7-bisphosphate phosphatase
MAGDKISDLRPAVDLGMRALFIRSRHEPDADPVWLREHRIPVEDTLYDHIKKGTAGS